MKFTQTVLGLLIFSLIVNVGFLYVRYDSAPEIVLAKNESVTAFVQRVYDFNNYKSSAYEQKTLQQRFDRLYSEYLKDKINPKESFYHNGVVDSDWSRKCFNNIKRITVITAKLDILENVINASVINDEKAKQEFDLLVEKKAYRDKLLDMSNFYAQFLTEEQYNYAQSTID